MPDPRNTGNTTPAGSAGSSPIQLPGNGPGRWNEESGARPSTTTTPIRCRLRVTAS